MAMVLGKAGYGLAMVLGAVAVALVFAHTSITAPYKVYIVASMLVFLALPWIARRRRVFGPVADSRSARAVRVGGYIVLSGLALVVVGVLSLHRQVPATVDPGFSQLDEDIELSVLAFALVAVYTAGMLAMTAQRSRVRSTTLAAGGALGTASAVVLCGLVPLGATLHPHGAALGAIYQAALVLVTFGAFLAAALISVRTTATARTDGSDHSIRARIGQGAVAGLLAAASGALVFTVLTLAGMLLVAQHVLPGLEASGLTSKMGPTSTQRVIGSATGTLLFVVMVWAPVAGAVTGAIGGVIGMVRARQPRPSGQPA